MSNLHKRAMEAVLQAADHDIVSTLQERGITDKFSDEGDEAILDVAILHGYRIFVRICEEHGLSVDALTFGDMAADLADEVARDEE